MPVLGSDIAAVNSGCARLFGALRFSPERVVKSHALGC